MLKRLKEGDRAILFKREDYLEEKVDLAAYSGKKVLLTFLRGTSCPFCLGRTKELFRNHDALKEKGIEVIAVVASDKATIQSTSKDNSAPCPIVPDLAQDVFKQYGMHPMQSITLSRMVWTLSVVQEFFNRFTNNITLSKPSFLSADFLLDEDQRVLKAYYGKFLGDHMSIEESLDV